jgi:hypothetical protein
MQSDYRVKKLVTEEGGDVIAICYDVLYGETFEKYIGIPDDFDARENAANLLQDSNYEISDDIRAELEETFGIAEFEDDQDYDSYQFYDFGDDEWEDEEDEFEDEEEFAVPTRLLKRESFNLREALNTIDLNTYNKYDLLNLYEACNLSENEKRALANIVYDQNDPSVIYDTLNNRFLGKEIEMPERVKDGVIHEDTNKSLSSRLVDFIKDYDFYHYSDTLEVGDTEEDAIKEMDRVLGDTKSAKSLLDSLIKMSKEDNLDDEQKENIGELIAGVKKLLGDSELKEDYEADTMTFSQWFDENQYHENEKYYPFDNYVKTFENAEVLRNATARDILNNAHIFYDIYDVDSVDREYAFNFASELLGLDYDVFYDAWLSGSPVPGTNLGESTNLNETTDKEFDARKKALYQKVRARLGVDNLIGTHDKWTDEENTEEKELSCISMLHSILTYSNDHSIERVMSDRYLQRHINELGEQRVRELAQQEIEEFANATINRNVHTDSEGVSYNSVTFRDDKNEAIESSTEWEHTGKDGRRGRIRQLDDKGNPKSLTRKEARKIADFRGHKNDDLNPVLSECKKKK